MSELFNEINAPPIDDDPLERNAFATALASRVFPAKR
jgi:hypothetical protein